MATRAVLVVSGAALLLMAVACGDDPSEGNSSAGSSSGAGAAGSPTEQPVGGATGNAGAGTAAAGEGGADSPASGSGGAGGAVANLASDVSGQVWDGLVPLANAPVAVNGVATTTDAEGHFQVADVADEYQLLVRFPGQKFAYIYDGVKTRTPRANVAAAFVPTNRSARLAGKLVGGLSDPLPQDARSAVVVAGQYATYTSSDYFGSPIDFEFDANWAGPVNQEVELWALQYLANGADGSYEYTGFGHREVNITDGGVFGTRNGSKLTDITLVDPPEVTLPTHATAPEGWTLDQARVAVGPIWARLEIPLGDGAVVLPQLDIPVFVGATASGDDEASDVVVTMPKQGLLDIVHRAPPSLASPDKDATTVTPKTEFFWEDMPENAVATVTFQVGDWTFVRSTAASSTTLPDLAPLRVRWSGAISGSWNVTAKGPATSVEEAMAIDDAINAGVPSTRFFSISKDRDFVTAE